jgi:16S rRNA G966 N2-methylase RsmD
VDLPPGSIAYIDPPYQGTTGYGNDLPRAEVCALAERWASAGALVVISEAEPIAELAGWSTVEITGERHGQKRTFSKQKREFLTMSAPPKWRPSVQRSLWAV